MSEIKSIQRLLAVQFLYQSSLNPDESNLDINNSLKEIIEALNLNKLKKRSNLNFAKNICTGVKSNNNAIDRDIISALGTSHSFKKFENLLKFILRAAVFELKYNSPLSKKIIISEYLKISDSFYDHKESSLVNGVLDNIEK